MLIPVRLVACALSILLVSGCATGASTSGSPQANSSQGPESASVGSEVDVEALTARIQTAAVDMITFHVDVTAQMTGRADVEVAGDIDRTDPNLPRMQTTATTNGDTTYTVVVDGAAYQSTDQESWTETGETTAVSQYLTQHELMLQYAQSAVYDGPDTVGSTDTDTYTLSVDPPEYEGDTTLKVWTDDQHRIVRYMLTVTSLDEEEVYDGEISNIGEPVAIEAPAVG